MLTDLVLVALVLLVVNDGLEQLEVAAIEAADQCLDLFVAVTVLLSVRRIHQLEALPPSLQGLGEVPPSSSFPLGPAPRLPQVHDRPAVSGQLVRRLIAGPVLFPALGGRFFLSDFLNKFKGCATCIF